VIQSHQIPTESCAVTGRGYRGADPKTSEQAGKLASTFASRHRALILGCLRAHGPNGKTVIGLLTALGDVAVARRLPELQAMGLAEPSGRFDTSDAGRLERVWRACK
jgi:hypothetical protein